MKLWVSVVLSVSIVMLMLYVFYFFADNGFLSNNQIAEIIRENSPRSEDMNSRFEKLYKKFGKGKTVPCRFYNNTLVDWQEIYLNIDYLLDCN